MRSVLRINGKIREDIDVSVDTRIGSLFVLDDNDPLLYLHDKGIFAEINLYGDSELFDIEK